MASLSSIKENSNANNWTIEQNENLATLYEAYRSSAKSISQSLPQAIRTILQKLSEVMNTVYRTLRDVAPLNKNIAKAYDSLMGFDSIQDKERSAERQEEFREFKERDKKETSKELKEQRTIENVQEELRTLFQTQDDISNSSTIEQYNAIRDKYYGSSEWLKAPNGEDTNLTEEQWIQVRTPNFIKWFGDWINDPDNASKVVDENREPLVVYHTTNANFDTFKVGERAGLSGKGIYFAVGGQGVPSYDSNTIEAFLNIRNPLTRELLETDKYSSINNNGNSAIQADVFEKYPEFDGVMVRRDEITVKDPNQIKSATENNGNFSTESDSILYQRDDNKRAHFQFKGKNLKNFSLSSRDIDRINTLLLSTPIDITSDSTIRENAKEVYKKINTVTNKETGDKVQFVNSAFGKIERHKDYDVRLVGQLANLFENSTFLFDEDADYLTPRSDGTLHKEKGFSLVLLSFAVFKHI